MKNLVFTTIFIIIILFIIGILIFLGPNFQYEIPADALKV
jgi:hypothetical protein